MGSCVRGRRSASFTFIFRFLVRCPKMFGSMSLILTSISSTPWFEMISKDGKLRSRTSICLVYLHLPLLGALPKDVRQHVFDIDVHLLDALVRNDFERWEVAFADVDLPRLPSSSASWCAAQRCSAACL